MNWEEILKDDTWIDPDPIKCPVCKTGNLISRPQAYRRAGDSRRKSGGKLVCSNSDCDYETTV